MLTMEPMVMVAEGPYRYRVRFERKGKEIEYRFTVTGDDIIGVEWEHDFWVATQNDPLVPTLMESILKFHEARQRE